MAEVPAGLKIALKQKCTLWGHDYHCGHAIVFSTQLAACVTELFYVFAHISNYDGIKV